MLMVCLPWRFCHVVGSLLVAVGLLLSQSLFAAPLPSGSTDADSLTDSVDLRPAFEKWGFGPRVQGKRGTCSVFAVAGALEYALASKQGRGTQLSVEFLNWASNQALGEMQDGSFFSDLWRGFAIYGVCPEEDMPYQDEFDPIGRPARRPRTTHVRCMSCVAVCTGSSGGIRTRD